MCRPQDVSSPTRATTNAGPELLRDPLLRRSRLRPFRHRPVHPKDRTSADRLEHLPPNTSARENQQGVIHCQWTPITCQSRWSHLVMLGPSDSSKVRAKHRAWLPERKLTHRTPSLPTGLNVEIIRRSDRGSESQAPSRISLLSGQARASMRPNRARRQPHDLPLISDVHSGQQERIGGSGKRLFEIAEPSRGGDDLD
jgi:hypothetical protein